MGERETQMALLRERGIAMSLEASERAHWRNGAYTFLCAYARSHAVFTGEDVSNAHIAQGLPQPKNLRWWGPLYRIAARDGYVKHLDNEGWSARRGSPCPRWRSLVCVQQVAA